MSIWSELASAGYDLGKESGLWKDIRKIFRKKRKILLLGASGSGKTRFIETVRDKLSGGLIPTQRTKDVEKRKADVNGYPFLILDTPGQLLDEAKRKKAINEAIRTGVQGIINLVCYGYHEADEADESEAIRGRGHLIANPEYLDKRRAVELELLLEWITKVDYQTADWILTIVSKADLWWPDVNNKIKEYYENGEYAEVIYDTRISHTVIPFCSVIEPFYGKRTSGKFGDREKALLRQHLLESIIRLSGIER